MARVAWRLYRVWCMMESWQGSTMKSLVEIIVLYNYFCLLTLELTVQFICKLYLLCALCLYTLLVKKIKMKKESYVFTNWMCFLRLQYLKCIMYLWRGWKYGPFTSQFHKDSSRSYSDTLWRNAVTVDYLTGETEHARIWPHVTNALAHGCKCSLSYEPITVWYVWFHINPSPFSKWKSFIGGAQKKSEIQHRVSERKSKSSLIRVHSHIGFSH